jgi:hypothetical protein
MVYENTAFVGMNGRFHYGYQNSPGIVEARLVGESFSGFSFL